MKTKQQFQKASVVIASLFILLSSNNLWGQITTVLPSNLNNSWFVSANPIQGLNTATIAGGTANIIACAYYDGGASPKIYVTDVLISTTPSFITSTGNMASVPDIIIGNANGGALCTSCSTTNDFILATAYVNTSGDIQIDFYDVFDNGTSISISSFGLSNSKTITGYVPRNVHLDVIYDQTNTVCNKYAVTWDDYTIPSKPRVLAAYGDLNANTIGSPQVISPASVHGHNPDVAAVSRTKPGGGFDDVALITYVDNNGYLYYNEWNMTTATSPAAINTLFDDGTSLPSVTYTLATPRIDAIDDDRYNGNLSNGNYEIAAQATLSSGEVRIFTYNNVISPLSHFGTSRVDDITGAPLYTSFTGPYENFEPTVALGDDGGGLNTYNYAIQHFLDISSAFPSKNMLFMEVVPSNLPYSFLSNTVYWVDKAAVSYIAIDAMSCNYANAACGAPNDPTQPVLCAWAYYDGTNYSVVYKQSYMSSVGFKQAPSGLTAVTSSTNSWLVYPNPATDLLTINRTGKHTTGSFQIIDVTGRVMLTGEVNTDKTDIDLSRIPAGAYLLKMQCGNEDKHVTFVKN
jgi:Secretion system C-terminal sorting domain